MQWVMVSSTHSSSSAAPVEHVFWCTYPPRPDIYSVQICVRSGFFSSLLPIGDSCLRWIGWKEPLLHLQRSLLLSLLLFLSLLLLVYRISGAFELISLLRYLSSPQKQFSLQNIIIYPDDLGHHNCIYAEVDMIWQNWINVQHETSIKRHWTVVWKHQKHLLCKQYYSIWNIGFPWLSWASVNKQHALPDNQTLCPP